MQSIVERSRAQLENMGEYVVRANISSGWFAMYPETWRKRLDTAAKVGRRGPNLIVYRTRTADPRDHHVIPHDAIRDLIGEDNISTSNRGTLRWNLALRDHRLRVTHRPGILTVEPFYGGELIIERQEAFMAEELIGADIHHEGAVHRVEVNAFERNRAAKNECIAHHGRRCSVCRMSFAEVYGDEAASIIHVHHLVELSTIRQTYAVDPVRDLRPVCPNCHAVIHSRRPAIIIDDVISMIERNRSDHGADAGN